MQLISQIVRHFRAVYTGGNWTAVNLKDTLAGITWQQATTKVESFNTIAGLVYHMNYYVIAVAGVLQGKPLEAKDKFSFDCPPVQSQQDWENLVNKSMTDAALFAKLIEQMPEEKLWEDFADKKYGNYYRNILGITEHNHYHLGQIVLIKKILLRESLNG